MRRTTGFTLLEVMIAVAIAAIPLTAPTQAMSGGNRAAAAAVAPSAGARRGDDGGGYDWSERVRPEGVQESAVLYDVQVRIGWTSDDGHRSVVLDTLRLAPAPGTTE